MAKQTFTTGQVLTAAQMTSLQQTAMLGGAASAKTASYTLVAADAGTAITMSNASATTITVNTALFAAGDTVQITNLGVGVCTITAGTATVNTSASLALAQYESGTLDFTSTSAAIFIKGAGASAASGGMTLLSTTTLTGSSVTISSISQAYKNLYVNVLNARNSTANQKFNLRINGDTGANYFTQSIQVYRALEISALRDTASTSIFLQYFGPSTTFYAPANGIINIPRYSEAELHTVQTNFRGTSDSSNTENYMFYQMGCLNSTSAITSLTFLSASGTFDAGTVYVYGVN